MSPTRVLLAAVCALLAASGCGTARHVVIPDNSDCWPGYHRSKALDLIAKRCPNGYRIEREEEVVTGTVTTDSETTDTHERDLLPKSSPIGASVTTTEKRHTTQTHNRTEWRIHYTKAGAAPAVLPAAHVVPQPPAPHLPREPIPVAR
jgi:hypothetical protein